jgi:Flp pilus assembly protein CpaB
VILQDVKVLAVDQQLEQANQADAAIVSVATLEVDPVGAERLIYAAHEGRLQLALRTAGDTEMVATRSVGVAEVLGESRPAKVAGKASPPVRRSSSVQVLLGSKLENRSF